MRVYSPLRTAVETAYTETLFFASNIGLVKAETSTSEGVVYGKNSRTGVGIRSSGD